MQISNMNFIFWYGFTTFYVIYSGNNSQVRFQFKHLSK